MFYLALRIPLSKLAPHTQEGKAKTKTKKNTRRTCNIDNIPRKCKRWIKWPKVSNFTFFLFFLFLSNIQRQRTPHPPTLASKIAIWGWKDKEKRRENLYVTYSSSPHKKNLFSQVLNAAFQSIFTTLPNGSSCSVKICHYYLQYTPNTSDSLYFVFSKSGIKLAEFCRGHRENQPIL